MKTYTNSNTRSLCPRYKVLKLLQGVLQKCSSKHKKESWQNSTENNTISPLECIGTNQSTPCMTFQTMVQGKPDFVSHSHKLLVSKQYISSSPNTKGSWMSLTS